MVQEIEKIIIGGTDIDLNNIIEKLQKEVQQVNNQIECILCGELEHKQKRRKLIREKQITKVMQEQDHQNVLDFLRGLVHDLSLK